MKNRSKSANAESARNQQVVPTDQLESVHGGTGAPFKLVSKPQPVGVNSMWTREVIEDVEAY
jgi:hypothetical protein